MFPVALVLDVTKKVPVLMTVLRLLLGFEKLSGEGGLVQFFLTRFDNCCTLI